MSKGKLLAIIVAASLLTLFFIIYFISTMDMSVRGHKNPLDEPSIKDTIRFEVLKNLIELLLVVIVGGFIAYVFKTREETIKKEDNQKEIERNDHKARMAIRVDYFSRLGEIYRTVKLVRRTLSAGGLTGQFENQPEKIQGSLSSLYLEQMKILNESQLVLEGLKIEANSLPALVKLKIIDLSLAMMEDYLRQILKEYERVSPLLQEGKAINFPDLKRLDEFTSEPDTVFKFPQKDIKTDKELERSKYRFKKNFSVPYANVIKAIGNNLR
jgi:hypothetical protein